MKEKTDDIILKTAINLFKQKGYSNVTMNEICDMCNITKSTFYYHYKTKDDLILRYYKQLSENVVEIMPNLLKDKPYLEKIWICFEYVIDNMISLGPELMKNLIQVDMNTGCMVFAQFYYGYSEEKKLFAEMIVELIRQGQQTNEIRNDIEAADLLTLYSCALMGVEMHWGSTGGEYDQKKSLKKLFNIAFKK